jgi:hypothetical protein
MCLESTVSSMECCLEDVLGIPINRLTDEDNPDGSESAYRQQNQRSENWGFARSCHSEHVCSSCFCGEGEADRY